jgi:hypothetical protein
MDLESASVRSPARRADAPATVVDPDRLQLNPHPTPVPSQTRPCTSGSDRRAHSRRSPCALRCNCKDSPPSSLSFVLSGRCHLHGKARDRRFFLGYRRSNHSSDRLCVTRWYYNLAGRKRRCQIETARSSVERHGGYGGGNARKGGVKGRRERRETTARGTRCDVTESSVYDMTKDMDIRPLSPKKNKL